MAYTKSKAGIGLGTVLSIGTSGASPTFTPVGEIKNLQQSGRQVATEDVTNMQSSAREFVPTLLDSGTWDITGSRIGGDAGQQAMESAFAGLVILPFKVQLPVNANAGQTTTGDLFAFNALVQECNYDLAVDKANTFSAKLKVSGVITVTPGS
jgi:hypothetical protein